MLELSSDGVLIMTDSGDIYEYDVSIKDIGNRLSQFNYTVTDADVSQLEFELTKTVNYVLNYCNRKDIPSILNPRVVDRVCADFLFNKKNSGTLDTFDYDVVIKSIKEGDTQIQYAVGQGEDTPESRFDAFIKSLERGFDKWLTPWRKLRW